MYNIGYLELFLVPRTRIPKWVKNRIFNNRTETKKIGKSTTRVLRIKNADCHHLAASLFLIRLRLKKEGRQLGRLWDLDYRQLLFIKDGLGNIIWKNYHYCEKCGENSTEVCLSKVKGMDYVVCHKCGSEWN